MTLTQARINVRIRCLEILLGLGYNLENPDPLHQRLDQLEEMILGPRHEDLEMARAQVDLESIPPQVLESLKPAAAEEGDTGETQGTPAPKRGGKASK